MPKELFLLEDLLQQLENLKEELNIKNLRIAELEDEIGSLEIQLDNRLWDDYIGYGE